MSLSVKLDVFEGPLDLLLHLLDENKVDIWDIPIVKITDQYMEYVSQLSACAPDMELMSEFLVMAATLLAIKSELLLPAKEKKEKEEETDPREALVARLLEYRICREYAGVLRQLETEGRQLFWEEERLPVSLPKKEPPDAGLLLDGVTMDGLSSVFRLVMRRQSNRMDPIRRQFGTIQREPIRLEDRMAAVMRVGRERKQFSFFGLLVRQEGREGVIVTFLACLELIRAGNLRAVQEAPFADIRMEWQETI